MCGFNLRELALLFAIARAIGPWKVITIDPMFFVLVWRIGCLAIVTRSPTEIGLIRIADLTFYCKFCRKGGRTGIQGIIGRSVDVFTGTTTRYPSNERHG